MMADSKRRSFPDFAKLLSKEPGWADEESALQEILAAFLRGQLSDVTCPRGDVGIGEHGVLLTRVAIPGPDPNPAVLPDPMYIPDRLIEMEAPLRHKLVPTLSPPQQPFTRDDWKEAFRAFGGQGQNVEVIGFEVLAEIPISAFPPEFRQAYIDWLYTTNATVGRWLRETGRLVPSWLKVHREDEQPNAPAKGHHQPGRPTPGRRGVKTSPSPKTPVPSQKKRGGGLKRGPYYSKLKKHLKWRKDDRDDLDTAPLNELCRDARRRLTTDGVKDIPNSRSGLEEAIKAALRDLGVIR